MFRFITHLLGKPFEECKSCETLKQQLSFAQEEKRELLNTLLGIVKPQVVEAPQEPKTIQPIALTTGTFARRRAALETRDRESARIQRESQQLARPLGVKVSDLTPAQQDNSIDELEKELRISDEVGER